MLSPCKPLFLIILMSYVLDILNKFFTFYFHDFRSRSFSYRHITISSIKLSFMFRRFITTVENEDN